MKQELEQFDPGEQHLSEERCLPELFPSLPDFFRKKGPFDGISLIVSKMMKTVSFSVISQILLWFNSYSLFDRDDFLN